MRGNHSDTSQIIVVDFNGEVEKDNGAVAKNENLLVVLAVIDKAVRIEAFHQVAGELLAYLFEVETNWCTVGVKEIALFRKYL